MNRFEHLRSGNRSSRATGPSTRLNSLMTLIPVCLIFAFVLFASLSPARASVVRAGGPVTIDICGRSPVILAAIVAQTNVACDQTTDQDLSKIKDLVVGGGTFLSGDLYGLSALEIFAVNDPSLPGHKEKIDIKAASIPSGFFQGLSTLKSVSIRGPAFLEDSIFDPTHRLQNVIVDSWPAFKPVGFACKSNTFTGLNTEELTVVYETFQNSRLCGLDSVTDLHTFRLRFGKSNSDRFPLEKLPASLENFDVGPTQNSPMDPPPTWSRFPTTGLPFAHSLKTLSLRVFELADDQFADLPQLENLLLVDSKAGPASLRTSHLKTLSLSMDDHVNGPVEADPSEDSGHFDPFFLQPLTELKTLILSTPHPDGLLTFDFSSQTHLKQLALSGFFFPTRKLLNAFPDLTKFSYASDANGNDQCQTTDAFVDLSHLEAIRLTGFCGDPPYTYDFTANQNLKSLSLSTETSPVARAAIQNDYGSRMSIEFKEVGDRWDGKPNADTFGIRWGPAPFRDYEF